MAAVPALLAAGSVDAWLGDAAGEPAGEMDRVLRSGDAGGDGMIWLQALWARIWPYIAAIGAALAAVVAIRQSGKAAGKAEAHIDQLKADASARRERDEAAATIERLDDAAVRDRARERMRDTDRR